MTVSNFAMIPIGVNLKTPTNGPTHEIGQIATGNYGGVWIYGKAVAAATLGDLVWFDATYQATALTTASSPRNAKVAVAYFNMTAGQWGWFQVGGQANVKAIAAIGVGVRVNTTATASSMDATGTVGAKEIVGLGVLTAIAGAGVSECVLTEPFVGVTL